MGFTKLHHDRATTLLRTALGAGAQRTGLLSATWIISGSCSDPWWTEYVGRPEGDPKYFTYIPGKNGTVSVLIATRCRRCAECRSYRSWEWQHRMTEELRLGLRSWYGTLTLAPAVQYRVLTEARIYYEARGHDWTSMNADERFRARARFALAEVTKYVKRFRKRAYGSKGKAPFKWVCITERHKSGLPHFHMLVHETSYRPITHAVLSASWGLGFERWRLVKVDERPQAAAWYLCKYLTKDFSTRIRASEKYGEQQTATVGALFASFTDVLGPNERVDYE